MENQHAAIHFDESHTGVEDAQEGSFPVNLCPRCWQPLDNHRLQDWPNLVAEDCPLRANDVIGGTGKYWGIMRNRRSAG